MVSITIILYNHGRHTMVVGKYTMGFPGTTICLTHIYTTSDKLPSISELNPASTLDQWSCLSEFSLTTSISSRLEFQSSIMAKTTSVSIPIQHIESYEQSGCTNTQVAAPFQPMYLRKQYEEPNYKAECYTLQEST